MTGRGLLATAALCLPAVSAGCGSEGDAGAERKSGAEGLKACVRDAGASIHRLPALRASHAPFEKERFRVELRTGDSAVVRVLTSRAPAARVARQHRGGGGAAMLQKGAILLSYSGRPDGTTTLEDCLRATGDGGDPRRGEIASQLRRIDARRKERSSRYRHRQYRTPEEISEQLDRLRSYRRYRLYYLGKRYRGLPLTSILSALQPPAYAHSVKRLPRPTSPTFTFIYGDCEPPPGREGGCPPPLSIQNFEVCAVSPKSHAVPPSALTERIRGVPVLRNTGAGSLNVFTGETTITIFGSSPTAMRAANDVQSIDGSVAAGSRLPPPVPGALEGRLRCRPPDQE
jgi:hypothetical protein